MSLRRSTRASAAYKHDLDVHAPDSDDAVPSAAAKKKTPAKKPPTETPTSSSSIPPMSRTLTTTMTTTTTSTNSNPATTSTTKRKRPKKDILTDPSSKLASMYLKDVINPETWKNLLTDDERRDLVKLLPSVDVPKLDDVTSIKDSNELIRDKMDPLFKYNYLLDECIITFQNNLFLGGYTPEYHQWKRHLEQRQRELRQKGLLGGTDAGSSELGSLAWMQKLKEEDVEKYWGEKLKRRNRAVFNAGQSAQITLLELCQVGAEKGSPFGIKQGDVLVYARSLRNIEVGMSLMIKRVLIPEQKLVLQPETTPKDEWEVPMSPQAIETLILNKDGQVDKKDRPNGNAWKSIKVRRAGKELGRLFNVRLEYFNSRNP